MYIKDHDIEILKALWRSHELNIPDYANGEVRESLENVIGILIKIQKGLESSSIFLELNPFESGVLTSTLYRSVDEGADPALNNIYNRLKDICNEKYYKD